MMKIRFSLLVLLVITGQNLMAQHDDHNESHHEHHKNEIGFANSPVYFVDEKEFAYGIHVHYIRNINESRFGIGLGFERIFDEHGHNTIQ